MHELINDSFYDILNKYDRLVIDYCLMENDAPHDGISSHKEALLYAMRRLKESCQWITVNGEPTVIEKISAEELLCSTEEPQKENTDGAVPYHGKCTDGGRIPYRYAFLEPPHGTGQVRRNGSLLRDRYGSEDFDTVNNALFPEGTEELEIHEWSTDWSSYFDAGHEWWGTLCYSIYDKKLNRYTVIMASSTD